MINLYDTLKASNNFRKIEVNELLFVEYTCMSEDTKFEIWSNNNYFAFILSGKKLWRTIYHSYEVNDGYILFVKKGANITHRFFDDEFCAIFIFIPDDFIRAFLLKYPGLGQGAPKDITGQDALLRVAENELLSNYFLSVQHFLSLSKTPNEHLLNLKFEELLLSLFSDKNQEDLTDYLISLSQNREHQLTQVMEKNFSYNLTLQDYAQLCHMSLSNFKKTFKKYYNTTPAAWLKERKLELACFRVINSDQRINEISFDCGFEDVSHFIRSFKQKHGLTPFRYRQKHFETSPAGI